ncbi:MAG: hypothetical protein HC934_09395 [Acaryochloridaceae cyanobacterium SU_2_1]|nr:hypothetical protein [Acaryochloridaceae cyanobacterium SU_2_1]NJM95433.1 hypothetical protein [Acaryochloridaceae cyanobacterium CSU_5_19]
MERSRWAAQAFSGQLEGVTLEGAEGAVTGTVPDPSLSTTSLERPLAYDG